jgi:hypothetical protein
MQITLRQGGVKWHIMHPMASKPFQHRFTTSTRWTSANSVSAILCAA